MIAKRLAERRFGLEFEHISKIEHQRLRNRLTEAGLEIDDSETSRAYLGWQVKSDGSISTQPEFPFATELTSPPITIKNYKEVVKVLEIASHFGGVNSSCGLHVHVHAPELASVLFNRPNTGWLEYISKTWAAIEPVMFSYMPMSRRHNNYCRSGVQWTTKYMAMNFSSLLEERCTVEFRLHNSTLNPMKAFAFAVLCRNIVEAMVSQKELPVLQARVIKPTQPKLVHTRHNSQFYLQRDEKGRWLIEHKNDKLEADNLGVAFKEFKRKLKLTGREYLPAFHYPRFGNAMGDLCEWADYNGAFRSFTEDRYDRMVAKHGVMNVTRADSGVDIYQDEENFYHEPELEISEQRDLPMWTTETAEAILNSVITSNPVTRR